jgi:hypothetical protein
VYGPYGPLGFFVNYSLFEAEKSLSAYDQGIAANAGGIATSAWWELLGAISTYAVAIAKWGKSYDGTILEREIWDYLDPAEEFDPNDPDTDDDEVPYLLDPRDWRSSFDASVGYVNELYAELDSIQEYWGETTGWYIALASGCMLNGSYTADSAPFGNPGFIGLPDMSNWTWAAYEAVNDTIVSQILQIPDAVPSPLAGVSLKNYLLGGFGPASDVPEMLLTGAGYNLTEIKILTGGLIDYNDANNYTKDYVLGLWGFGDGIIETVRATYKALVPWSSFEYLMITLEAGQPCCGPDAASFIKRAVKEFNVREDGNYRMPWIQHGNDLDDSGDVSPIPLGKLSPNGVDLGGETIYVNVAVDLEVDDAGTVTVEIEYDEDGQIDPRDSLRWKENGAPEKFWGDGEDELEDWEWQIYSVSDLPNQIRDGDTILWESTPMEGPIPGYETPVILGVALVSVIGLIYVVMKKRKK